MIRLKRGWVRVSLVAAGMLVASGLHEGSFAQQKPIPPLPPEKLENAEAIQVGKGIWDDNCTHCHGRNAYPGKAPKLQPGRYSPQFVYHRVTYGFRGMPPWEEAYSEEERVALVAYILSPQFAP